MEDREVEGRLIFIDKIQMWNKEKMLENKLTYM